MSSIKSLPRVIELGREGICIAKRELETVFIALTLSIRRGHGGPAMGAEMSPYPVPIVWNLRQEVYCTLGSRAYTNVGLVTPAHCRVVVWKRPDLAAQLGL